MPSRHGSVLESAEGYGDDLWDANGNIMGFVPTANAVENLGDISFDLPGFGFGPTSTVPTGTIYITGGGASGGGAPNNGPKPQQAQQPQNTMSCGGSLAVLGIGVVTTGAAVAGLIYAPELEPEIYEGIGGMIMIQHLSVPAMAPLMVLVEGAQASWQNCHH